MTALAPHDHDLDGRRHDGCPMCDEAKRRDVLAQRDRSLDAAVASHAERARRSRVGRAVIADDPDGWVWA